MIQSDRMLEGSFHANTLNKLQSFKSGTVAEIAGMSRLITGGIVRRMIDKLTLRGVNILNPGRIVVASPAGIKTVREPGTT